MIIYESCYGCCRRNKLYGLDKYFQTQEMRY